MLKIEISECLNFNDSTASDVAETHAEICSAILAQIEIARDALENISGLNDDNREIIFQTTHALSGLKHLALTSECIAKKFAGYQDLPGKMPIVFFPKGDDWNVILADKPSSKYYEAELSVTGYSLGENVTFQNGESSADYEIVGFCRQLPNGYSYLRYQREDNETDFLNECKDVIDKMSDENKLKALAVLKTVLAESEAA